MVRGKGSGGHQPMAAAFLPSVPAEPGGLGSPGHGGSVLPTSAWLSGPWFNQQLQQEQLPGLF